MARRSEHTREELESLMLQESMKIVAEEGFEGLTARRLAEAVGYAPGTIYNVFHSMDDLYLKVNGVTLDTLYDTLSSPECSDPALNSIKNMKAMAGRYQAFCQEHRLFWLMLFTHRLPEGRNVPDWYQAKIEKLFLPLEELLREFYDAKDSRHRKMSARILWSSVHGLCFLEQTGKFSLVNNDMTIHHMMNYLIDCFTGGIPKQGSGR